MASGAWSALNWFREKIMQACILDVMVLTAEHKTQGVPLDPRVCVVVLWLWQNCPKRNGNRLDPVSTNHSAKGGHWIWIQPCPLDVAFCSKELLY